MFVIIIRVIFNDGQGQQFARDAFSCLRQSPYHVLMMMALTFSDESLARDIHTDTHRDSGSSTLTFSKSLKTTTTRGKSRKEVLSKCVKSLFFSTNCKTCWVFGECLGVHWTILPT